MSDSCLLPDFTTTQVAAYARDLFALDGPVTLLNGERDLNFSIGEIGSRHLFKIANADEERAMLDCQHLVFQRLAQNSVFPRTATACVSKNGNLIESVLSDAGSTHLCRALPFIEGRLLLDVETLKPALLHDFGRRLALLNQALESFSHPALERPLWWRMDLAPKVLASLKPKLADSEQRDLVEYFEAGYLARVLPRHDELRRAVIHNDANRGNVLVDTTGSKVISIIDFGDMIESWLVAEVAIAAAYVMLETSDPLTKARHLLRGYQSQMPLLPIEIELLFDFICMRLCMSVCISAHQSALAPHNPYLRIDVEPTWALLKTLRHIQSIDATTALTAV